MAFQDQYRPHVLSMPMLKSTSYVNNIKRQTRNIYSKKLHRTVNEIRTTDARMTTCFGVFITLY